MTTEVPTKRNLCVFDPANPCDNVPRLDELSLSEACDHIRKAMPKSADFDFYVVMDSTCHKRHGAEDVCDKKESALLRLLLKWSIKNRNMKPRAITCVLKSYRQDLLRFPEGESEGAFSVLDLKHKPLWITPKYKKAANVACRDTTVLVEKTPGVTLERAPLQVDVSLWKEYPTVSNGSQNVHLEVAVPPADPATPTDGPPTLQQDAPVPLPSPAELFEVLSNLSSVMLDGLITRADIPRSNLSHSSVPVATRAHEVLEWFKSQGESNKQLFMKELRKIVPGRF